MQSRWSRWKRLQCMIVASCSFFVGLNFWQSYVTILQGEQHGSTKIDPKATASLLPSAKTWFRSTSAANATGKACEGYDGIYHIKMGDIGGAAGTIFFQFVIGQILYAERHNLKPWVFLDNTSYIIYDEEVHGKGPGVSFTMLGGVDVERISPPNAFWRDVQPGAPIGMDKAVPTRYKFEGDGVWTNYFEPVSDFVPGDASCANKPLVTLDLKLVTPGIHGFAPWAPRCWRYHYLPDYVTKPHVPIREWLEPQRRVAHRVARQYIRFAPHLDEKAAAINPGCSYQEPCLGLHIRQSDKAGGRRQIHTSEFLPYAQAFADSGGAWIYLATDSGKVLEQIRRDWPSDLQKRLRTIGDNVVRSNDKQAVFDIASHHRTNTEILIEILALSKCQFLVHGLSAVTESSIWMNVQLHDQSVDLEDPDHMNATEFGTVVRSVLDGGNATQMALDRRTSDWWAREIESDNDKERGTEWNDVQRQLDGACEGFDGILHISHVGGGHVGAASAFFVSVLNQIAYAERHNLKPWVHLGKESSLVYDDIFHGTDRRTVSLDLDYFLRVGARHGNNRTQIYAGAPVREDKSWHQTLTFAGNGVWESYFETASNFNLSDKSCASKPIVSIPVELVSPGLRSWDPESIRPWRYDDVPDEVWNPNNLTLRDLYAPMRRKASAIVKKYFHFRPHIIKRAAEVNPIDDTCLPCLAVHLRNSDKNGLYRNKFPPNKLRDYMKAFIEAGGKSIYIASDSHRTLEHIDNRFAAQIRHAIRTQGPYVVRFSTKWTIHELEDRRHRTNSEVLVDILAMSKCQLMLHGNSAVSEAVMYLNPGLHNHSVNKEDPDAMSVGEFKILSNEVLSAARAKNVRECAPPVPETPPHILDAHISNDPVTPEEVNLSIIKGSARPCRRNAIVYLAQKKHSSYGRDSFGVLLKSIRLIQHNYLSINGHTNNTDILIFHTGDFNETDMTTFRARFGGDLADITSFIDLSNTPYWRRPAWHENDDPQSWYAFPLFSEGYRKMIHWFAIDIWRFFADYNKRNGCSYEYIMRFDEDSFLRSPVRYDIFDFMRRNEYEYGFRMCSYEMQYTQRIWALWRKSPEFIKPLREHDLRLCGFYNNFFVANVKFFQSEPVQRFLNFVDRQGMIYRRRLGDLMIHSLAVYSFAPANRIHRFLDFTYEHSTADIRTGCVLWGGIQAGYEDAGADSTVDAYIRGKVRMNNCDANLTIMSEHNLSPTYAHLPDRLGGKLKLKTVTAGNVEVPGKGLLSG